MKSGNKNPVTMSLVEDMRSAGLERRLFKSLALKLERPRRRRHEVSVSSIQKHAKPKETVVVPGIVLGNGEISKAVSVAALKFSAAARSKIEKAGGRCITLDNFKDSYRKGMKIRIMG